MRQDPSQASGLVIHEGFTSQGRARAEPQLTRQEVVPERKDAGGYGSGLPGTFYGLGFFPGSTGIPVTPYSALQAATFYACADRVSKDIGKLSVQVMRRQSRGFRLDLEHPLNRLLRRPNRWQTPSQCWSYYVWALAVRGNAYAPIIRGPGGEPQELVPVSPDRVSVLLSTAGNLMYRVNHPLREINRTLDADNVLHAKGMSLDGLTGISPVAVAQDVLGLALATQQHGATLFRQGAQLNGVITHPGKLLPEGKDYLSSRWSQQFSGVQNAHGTPVLDEGMKFEKIAMTNEDSQFLETRQMQVLEICRIMGVPPHKVFDLRDAHYNNLEQSEQQYVNDTLLPIGKQIGELCERNLLFEDEQDRLAIRINWDELLRADRKTRYDTYAVGINNGFLSRNEARVDDNREPNVPNGDEYLQRLDTTTSGNAPAAAPAAAPATQEP